MTRSRPTISVVTVTRNDMVGLLVMTESLKIQSYESIEHVIVDGASMDGTLEWLEAYSAPYKLKWVSEPDGGIFDAMNKGVSLATGDLVVFMNGGDSFSDFSVLERVADRWAVGKWRWGYGAMRYVDLERTVKGAALQFPYSKRRLELGLAFAPHQATYVERSLFSELAGFDLSFDYASDQEFAMRAGMVTPPEVWLDFTSDFLVGGVHSQSSYWNRELLYSRMRQKNGVTFGGSVFADRLFALAVATYREARERASEGFSVIRKRGNRA